MTELIIWDWNGTLFNDVEWCICVINNMLISRGHKPLESIAEYHDAFCFPVIDYYKKVGFDFEKEPFEVLAEEYIAAYLAGKTGNCGLNNHAETVLAKIHSAGIKQVILSASETNNLRGQISEFGIAKYFDEILGLSDIYAESKLQAAVNYIAANRAISLDGEESGNALVAAKPLPAANGGGCKACRTTGEILAANKAFSLDGEDSGNALLVAKPLPAANGGGRRACRTTGEILSSNKSFSLDGEESENDLVTAEPLFAANGGGRKACRTAGKILLVGDTLHDYEVAATLNADCLLYSAGHQSRERLMTAGVPVLGCLLGVLDELGIRN
ncbi:MAG: HAD hydrolase-like protein [Oscillospiraceae bacterium]|nr:HAD hydrolase-like protein [Oscillospiraceae bacterium]